MYRCPECNALINKSLKHCPKCNLKLTEDKFCKPVSIVKCFLLFSVIGVVLMFAGVGIALWLDGLDDEYDPELIKHQTCSAMSDTYNKCHYSYVEGRCVCERR